MGEIFSDTRKQLISCADEKYRLFMMRLIPGHENILGVRTPRLRHLAKQLAKDDWQSYFALNPHEYYEETLLNGLTIGYLTGDAESVLEQVELFLPRIDNWAVCDSFCAGLKIAKTHSDLVWRYVGEKLKSKEAYVLRFSVVMLLDYYIDSEHIVNVLEMLDSVKHEDYYVKMAVSWAVSACYARFPKETMIYLQNNTLDNFTYNKALQKICESLKTDEATKKKLKSMKYM